jgi:leader peptidase (prepilin peptidase)/N-methyltransferase
MGLVGWWLWVRNGSTLLAWREFFFEFAIMFLFISLFVIDIKHYILPNVHNALLACLFLGAAFLKNKVFFALLGATIGAAFPAFVIWIFYKLKGKMGMGMGDIKLYAALGLYLGPEGVLNTIFLSCFVGSLYSGILLLTRKLSRDTPFAFGPAIIITAFLQIFFSDQLSQVLAKVFAIPV